MLITFLNGAFQQERMVSLEECPVDFLVGIKSSKKLAYIRNLILTKSVNNFEILPHTFP